MKEFTLKDIFGHSYVINTSNITELKFTACSNICTYSVSTPKYGTLFIGAHHYADLVDILMSPKDVM